MKGVRAPVGRRIPADLRLPTLDVRSDELIALTRAALHRPLDSDSEWEDAFARSFLASATIRRIAHALAFRYPIDLDDVRQQLAITMLQKLRNRDFNLTTGGEFLALTFKIGERYCLANIQDTWDTRSLEDLREQASALGTPDPGDASDEGEGMVDMERLASLEMSGRREQLREYVLQRRDPQKSSRSNTHKRAIRQRPAGDHSVPNEDDEPRIRSGTPANNPEQKLNQVDAVLKSSQEPPMASPTGRTAGRRRNAEQQELFSYWTASGLSQLDFAASIDVSLAALKSYIYGKTKDVPTEVVEKARTHRSKTEPLTEKLRDHFKFPMAIILARWERRLGLTEPRDGDIASVLGVNHTTVLRWRSEDTKPKVRDLARYELAVNAWASKTAESKKIASELVPLRPRKSRKGGSTKGAAKGRATASK